MVAKIGVDIDRFLNPGKTGAHSSAHLQGAGRIRTCSGWPSAASGSARAVSFVQASETFAQRVQRRLCAAGKLQLAQNAADERPYPGLAEHQRVSNLLAAHPACQQTQDFDFALRQRFSRCGLFGLRRAMQLLQNHPGDRRMEYGLPAMCLADRVQHFNGLECLSR